MDDEAKLADLLRVGKAVENEKEWRKPVLAGTIPTPPFRFVVSGPSYSGKSNLVSYMLRNLYKRPENGSQYLDRLVLISPTAPIDHLYDQMEGLDKRDRISSLDPQFLEDILAKQTRLVKTMGRDKAPHVCLIIDDSASHSSFINSQAFLSLFVSGRHRNVSSIFLTQSWCKMPRSARIQATHVAFFPSKKTEVQRVYDECCPRSLDPKEFSALVDHATEPRENDRYPFLYIDMAAGNRRFRRSFNEQYVINEGGPLPEN